MFSTGRFSFSGKTRSKQSKHGKHTQPTKNRCDRSSSRLTALILSLISTLAIGSATAADYQTRIALTNAATTLGVDEIVISWSTEEISGTVSVADGTVTDLSMKVDDVVPVVGNVFIDDILIGGILQPTGSTPPRAIEDVIFEFDLDSMQLLHFRNATTVSGIPGVFYKVEDGSLFGGASSYQVVTYNSGDDKSWDAAKTAAEDLGGYLAIINDEAEDLLVTGLVATASSPLQAWAGGYQLDGSAEPGEGWVWLDGTAIPEPGATDGYENWTENEPNDAPGAVENHLAIGKGGVPGWNDEGFYSQIGSYLVEFPNGALYITRYIDGVLDDGEIESPLIQRSARVTGLTVRNIFNPLGPGTIFDTLVSEQEGNTSVSGLTSMDACFGLDPREPIIVEGDGRIPAGQGGAGGADNNPGSPQVFNKRDLNVAELSGTGNCTGAFEIPDDTYDSWEELLADVNLVIPSYNRGFVGKYDFTDNGIDDPVQGVWIMVVVVRSTADYDGPVSRVVFNNLIDYSDTPAAERPYCANNVKYRPVDLGGTVPAFGDWPNVEGNQVIQEIVECNIGYILGRRTVHIAPMRIASPGNSMTVENTNMNLMFTGLQGTIFEANSCTNPALISAMQTKLDAAKSAFAAQNYLAARTRLEEGASFANNDDGYDTGGPVGFNSCPVGTNYRGGFVARFIAAAFNVHDRFLNRETFVLYDLPAEFDALKPDLRGL